MREQKQIKAECPCCKEECVVKFYEPLQDDDQLEATCPECGTEFYVGIQIIALEKEDGEDRAYDEYSDSQLEKAYRG